nr:N-acetylmuramoyl-L-alanine amidase [uncultured Mediterraneibacter sp.]
MKIYLSPSSQAHNAYAVGNTTEQAQCNRIAAAAKVALERNGYTVRKAPEGQSYARNVAESNAWGADIHMPIHTNAGGSSKGTMGLCYAGSVTNKYMQAVYKAVAECTPWDDKGIVVRSDLYEINQTKMMCVYIECAFHDKADSAQWIINNVNTIGEAIAKGFCAADGKTYKSASGSVSKPKQVPGNPVNDMGVKYRAHCQTIGDCAEVRDGQTAGTTGFGKRLEALYISLEEAAKKLGVDLKLKGKYHLQGTGWVDLGYITKDTMIGSKGQGKRLEAIILEIEGLPEGYELQYRTHIQTVGWTGWVAAGFASGSVGFRKGIEAIQIRIVKK